MKEFRKKQKRLYAFMKALIIVAAVCIFIFIGIKPAVAQVSTVAVMVCNYTCDFLILSAMAVLFIYYSKYGKSDAFLTSVENELSDAGYYLTSRAENTQNDYVNAVILDLQNCGYSVNRNVEINELEFDFKAESRKEFFYCIKTDNADKNDILAYLDSVIYDITVKSLKRKGNAVICFVTDKAEDEAIALSKMITPLGKKEQIKIAVAVCELSSRRVYFLGNIKTKCQQMIANFVMNCDVPIKEQYIGKERLPFQVELEEHMKSFNIKDFKSGNFYAHE